MARLTGAKAAAASWAEIPSSGGIVLDRMMANPSIPGPARAIRDEWPICCPRPYAPRFIGADCYRVGIAGPANRNLRLYLVDSEIRLLRLIRHRPVQILVAADWIAHAIEERWRARRLLNKLPRDLVRETASRIADDSEAIERLRKLLMIGDWRVQPMAASLLHALGFGWKPDRPVPLLAGATWSRPRGRTSTWAIQNCTTRI